LVYRYLDAGSYRDALALINSLLRELKKLDDKHILTEVHLLESRANYALSNLPKAKAALTSARTAANAIYIPQELQARLDLQSGILHAEDKDYNTGCVLSVFEKGRSCARPTNLTLRSSSRYSYFFEAVEALSVQSDPDAVPALKYMLLCKIMLSLVRYPNELAIPTFLVYL
jgi:26S proteasome regulatory subunit N6